jgi:hypothetical protein
MRDRFDHDFWMGLQANPHKYMGMNLGYTTWAQQYAKL